MSANAPRPFFDTSSPINSQDGESPIRGTTAWDLVVQDELKEIRRRRTVAFPDRDWVSGMPVEHAAGDDQQSPDAFSQSVPNSAAAVDAPVDVRDLDNVVGVALSGGGIRSAVFNLGLLQGLARKGFLRYVDYISSVSGGGYISGHVATLATRLHERNNGGDSLATNDAQPLESAPPRVTFFDAPAPHLVESQQPNQSAEKLYHLGLDPEHRLSPSYRFLHIGSYLFDDILGLAWRYLYSTVATVALAVSWLGVMAALVALAWRSLDVEPVRDILQFTRLNFVGLQLGLGDETLFAFLPALAASFGFFCLWCVRLATKFAQDWKPSPGRVRLVQQLEMALKFGLCATAATYLVSFAVLLGNGEMQFGSGVNNKSVVIQQNYGWILLPLAILSLFPAFGFRSVLNSAQDNAPAWRTTAYQLIMTFASISAPFFMVYWMARENVSGCVSFRGPQLWANDVKDWPSFAFLIDEYERSIRKELADREKRDDKQEPFVGTALRSELDRIHRIAVTVESLVANVAASRSTEDFVFGKDLHERKLKSPLSGPSACEQAVRESCSALIWGGGRLVKRITGASPSWPVASLEVREVLDNRSMLRGLEAQAVGQANSTLLASPRFTHWLISLRSKQPAAKKAPAGPVPFSPDASDDRNEAVAQIEAASDEARRLLERAIGGKKSLSEAELRLGLSARGDRKAEFDDSWSLAEIQMLNRHLLETLFPATIRNRGQISTVIVPPYDQAARGWWLVFWSSLAVVLGYCIDWNSSSPFYSYYRARLKKRFLDSASPRQSSVGGNAPLWLHDVKSTKVGAPYPLFVGSLQYFGRVASAGVPAPKRPIPELDHVSAQTIHPIIFSPRWVGSPQAGFCKSEEYCGGRLSVADAVAISGAAVTPFMVGSTTLRVLMAVFNMRLGQWLWRPGAEADRNGLPRVSAFRIVRSYLESWWNPQPYFHGEEGRRSTLAFAADGGFHEFLGVEELIRRRCRLIVISDAGCNNGKFEFGVLADLIRLCRVRHGVQFLELDHDVPVDLEQLRRSDQTNRQSMHFICFRIRYPEHDTYGRPISGANESLCVYAQMSITGDEEIDLQQFRNINPNFPDEPTTNQYYSRDQVESYRQLGCHIASSITEQVARENDVLPPQTVEDWIDVFRGSFLTHRWASLEKTGKGLPMAPSLGDSDLRLGNIRSSKARRRWNEADAAVSVYFESPFHRQIWLERLERLLQDSADFDRAANPGGAKPAMPLVTDKISTMVADVVWVMLASHSLGLGGVFASTCNVFLAGGRRNLVTAAVWWHRVRNADLNFSRRLTDGDDEHEGLAQAQAEFSGPERLADHAVAFAKLLSNDVFRDHDDEAIGLGLACLISSEPDSKPFSIEWAAEQIARLVKQDRYSELRRYLTDVTTLGFACQPSAEAAESSLQESPAPPGNAPK